MQSADSKTHFANSQHKPKIIARSEHGISRSQISENALKILHRLNEAGNAAYLVGGCVRDILLGIKPKDFDVATDAHPEQVKALFRNCRLIGRRFRLAHIYFGKEIIEVSTFRTSHNEASNDKDGIEKCGRVLRDNVYGQLDDDVWRRDLTVNALYYNIEDLSIVDYVNGIQDLHNRQLRIIGNAEDRFREDPVRILRVLRFAAKLDFSIHSECVQPLLELAPLLNEIPKSRLFDEVLKLFMSGHAMQCYQKLREYGLFRILFPQTEAILNHGNPFVHKFISSALSNTDQRIAQDMSVTPAFLLAAILWIPVRQLADHYQDNGSTNAQAIKMASDKVITQQNISIAIPRRFLYMMRDIWSLQIRLQSDQEKVALQLLKHRRFRAAYDLLLLRAEENAESQAQADWWTKFSQQNIDIQLAAKKQHQKRYNRFRRKNYL